MRAENTKTKRGEPLAPALPGAPQLLPRARSAIRKRDVIRGTDPKVNTRNPPTDPTPPHPTPPEAVPGEPLELCLREASWHHGFGSPPSQPITLSPPELLLEIQFGPRTDFESHAPPEPPCSACKYRNEPPTPFEPPPQHTHTHTPSKPCQQDPGSSREALVKC